MSDSRIIKVARQTALATVGEVLQKAGLEPELITYSEIRKLYGRKLADKARNSMDIEWYPGPRKGNGNMVFCKRSEFREYLFNHDEKGVEKSFSIIN